MIRVLYCSNDSAGIPMTRISNVEASKKDIENFIEGKLCDDGPGYNEVAIALSNLNSYATRRLVKELKKFDHAKPIILAYAGWGTRKTGKQSLHGLNDTIYSGVRGNVIIYQGFTVPDIRVHG